MDQIVGTAGHIDHGKTSLVKALTGTDADRLPEEKRRGITVDLGFAEMIVGEAHFGFVDVPGHERFVKNMLAGASGIDIVMLVIAADDGVMPQTREHFDICRLLGVRAGIIAITKSDLVDDDTLELARMDAADLVAGSFLASAPMIAVSSTTGDGIDEIRSALLAAAQSTPAEADDHVTRLPIDRSFSMKGFGTVVTGTLASGEIKAGDELELLPERRRVKVRGLQSHGRAAETVTAGRRVAVNLSGVGHDDIERGALLAAAGVLEPTQMLDAAVEVLSDSARPLRSRQRLRFHIGTAEVLARVKILNDVGEISPGSSGHAQFTLESPVAAVPGERFIIRSYSPQMTIAGGEVIDNLPAKHRTRDRADVVALLEELRSCRTPTNRVEILLSHAGRRGMSRPRLRSCTGVNDSSFDSALSSLVKDKVIVVAGDHLVSSKVFATLGGEAVEAVMSFHKRQPLAKGMSRDEIRDRVFSNIPDAIANAVIDDLIKSQRLVADSDTVRDPEFSNVLSTAEAKTRDLMLNAIGSAGLNVEKIDDVIRSSIAGTGVSVQQATKLLRLLVEAGKVVKVSDDFYFGTAAIDELVSKLRGFASNLPDRLIDVGGFKDLAGVSRKYAIPLLEYFDRAKITVRAGEKRLIR